MPPNETMIVGGVLGAMNYNHGYHGVTLEGEPKQHYVPASPHKGGRYQTGQVKSTKGRTVLISPSELCDSAPFVEAMFSSQGAVWRPL